MHPLKRERNDVLFFATGGGSDLSTAEVVRRSMTISGAAAVCVALGPKGKEGVFDYEATAEYYASYYAGDFAPLVDKHCSIAVEAIKSQRTPKKLEGAQLTKALEEIEKCRMLTSEQQQQFQSECKFDVRYILQGRAGTYFGLIVGDTDEMQQAAARALAVFLNIKYGKRSWELVCVDTGGDILASTEEEAASDMVLAEDGGLRPRKVDDTVDSLVTAGMKYIPDGAGFGDRSYHQYGPSLSKRDEASLKIARSLSFHPQSLWVIGLGADGETSERGLEQGLAKYPNAFQGNISSDLAAAMREVDDFREPQENRTPCIILEATRGVEHVTFTRGSKTLKRRPDEERGKGFTSTVPGMYAAKYLVFDSLSLG
eukprot:GEMP01058130.1.p1 GENE.GEMP01058130.1~~GEMP01058130.1.p1  ORF type:complete len:371 (+),score=80.81 GEMP01058130.1:123-1235(+)